MLEVDPAVVILSRVDVVPGLAEVEAAIGRCCHRAIGIAGEEIKDLLRIGTTRALGCGGSATRINMSGRFQAVQKTVSTSVWYKPVTRIPGTRSVETIRWVEPFGAFKLLQFGTAPVGSGHGNMAVVRVGTGNEVEHGFMMIVILILGIEIGKLGSRKVLSSYQVNHTSYRIGAIQCRSAIFPHIYSLDRHLGNRVIKITAQNTLAVYKPKRCSRTETAQVSLAEHSPLRPRCVGVGLEVRAVVKRLIRHDLTEVRRCLGLKFRLVNNG